MPKLGGRYSRPPMGAKVPAEVEGASLPDLIASLHEIRQQKSALEKSEKEVLAQLKPLADPKFDALPDEPIVADGLALTRGAGVTRSISGEKLLERGVSPEIVAYATSTTPYFRYSVKERKK